MIINTKFSTLIVNMCLLYVYLCLCGMIHTNTDIHIANTMCVCLCVCVHVFLTYLHTFEQKPTYRALVTIPS